MITHKDLFDHRQETIVLETSLLEKSLGGGSIVVMLEWREY